MNTNQMNPNGPAFDRRNLTHPILYCDSTCAVDLNVWREPVQSWVIARAAVQNWVTTKLLLKRIPHSPAIDTALGLLPIQDQISLLHTVVEDENFKFPGIEVKSLAALEACSAALAKGDQLIYRLTLWTSKINPEDISGTASALEKALIQLKEAL